MRQPSIKSSRRSVVISGGYQSSTKALVGTQAAPGHKLYALVALYIYPGSKLHTLTRRLDKTNRVR